MAYSGTDVTRAMEDTETVFVVAPAFATADIARLAAPYLRAGMVVAVCPGSCVGSLVFKEAAGLDVHDERVIIGETNTLPYAPRRRPGSGSFFPLVLHRLLRRGCTSHWKRPHARGDPHDLSLHG